MLLNSPIEPPQRAIQLDIDIDENGGSGQSSSRKIFCVDVDINLCHRMVMF